MNAWTDLEGGPAHSVGERRGDGGPRHYLGLSGAGACAVSAAHALTAVTVPGQAARPYPGTPQRPPGTQVGWGIPGHALGIVTRPRRHQRSFANSGQDPRHIAEHHQRCASSDTSPRPTRNQRLPRSLSRAGDSPGVPVRGRPTAEDRWAVTAWAHEPGGCRPCGSQATISHVRGDSAVISVLASATPRSCRTRIAECRRGRTISCRPHRSRASGPVSRSVLITAPNRSEPIWRTYW